MKISELIISEILKDNNLSLALSKSLGVQQQSVLKLAKRNSPKLGRLNVIEYYIDNGFSLEEIYTKKEDVVWVREYLNHHKRKAKV